MWYVIQVISGTEHVIEQQCNKMIREGEEVFIPLIKRIKRVRGVDLEEQKTMFPGYVFFDTNEIEDLFIRLKKISKLTKILKTGDEFTPISEKEEEMIRRLGGSKHLIELSIGFKEGDKVVITDGPLLGLESRIRSINRTRRTAVLEVPLMGETRDVTVALKVLNKDTVE